MYHDIQLSLAIICVQISDNSFQFFNWVLLAYVQTSFNAFQIEIQNEFKMINTGRIFATLRKVVTFIAMRIKLGQAQVTLCDIVISI